MSRILDIVKKAPAAIQKVESDLPRSDQGIRDFPGKGLLTALVDTSGTELKRQRDLEDGLKMSMVKPLIEKYWMGDPGEREAVAEQIKSTLGGGKRTKAFLDKMFEVGGQIHGVNSILNPPPAAIDQATAGAVDAAKQDQGEGGQTQTATPGPGAGTEGEGVASVSPVLPPPPTVTPAPASAAAPLTPPPTGGNFESFRAKAFPTALSEADKLALQHRYDMEKQKNQQDAAMDLLKAQIEAGRFDKALKLEDKVELIDGKAKYVRHWYDKDGNEVKKEVGGDALPNWAGRPKQGFMVGPNGQPISILLDPFTNQIIDKSENEKVIVPPAMLPRLSTREVIVQDPDTGEFKTIPLSTTRGVVLGGPTSQNQPTTAPANATAVPDDAMVNFIMSKNKGTPREEVVQAIQQTSPETMATLRQQATDAGFLLAPPSGGGSASPASVTAPSGATGGAGPSAASPATQGPVSTTQPALTGRALPGVITPGQYNASTQRAVPIREAYTQMVGSPDFPEVPSMLTFAKIADDPARRDKLSKALKLTFDGIQQDETAHGSLVNLLKLYAGIPAAEINAKLATYASGIGDMLKDDPELQDAYNAEMAMFATAVGMRSLTRASAAQSSVQNIEREIPLFGVNTFSSRDVYSKLGRLLLEVHNGAKNTPTISQKEKTYISNRVDELNRLARGSAISKPPTAAGRVNIRVKATGQTGSVDAADFDPATMDRR